MARYHPVPAAGERSQPLGRPSEATSDLGRREPMREPVLKQKENPPRRHEGSPPLGEFSPARPRVLTQEERLLDAALSLYQQLDRLVGAWIGPLSLELRQPVRSGAVVRAEVYTEHLTSLRFPAERTDSASSTTDLAWEEKDVGEEAFVAAIRDESNHLRERREVRITFSQMGRQPDPEKGGERPGTVICLGVTNQEKSRLRGYSQQELEQIYGRGVLSWPTRLFAPQRYQEARRGLGTEASIRDGCADQWSLVLFDAQSGQPTVLLRYRVWDGQGFDQTRDLVFTAGPGKGRYFPADLGGAPPLPDAETSVHFPRLLGALEDCLARGRKGSGWLWYLDGRRARISQGRLVGGEEPQRQGFLVAEGDPQRDQARKTATRLLEKQGYRVLGQHTFTPLSESEVQATGDSPEDATFPWVCPGMAREDREAFCEYVFS